MPTSRDTAPDPDNSFQKTIKRTSFVSLVSTFIFVPHCLLSSISVLSFWLPICFLTDNSGLVREHSCWKSSPNSPTRLCWKQGDMAGGHKHKFQGPGFALGFRIRVQQLRPPFSRATRRPTTVQAGQPIPLRRHTRSMYLWFRLKDAGGRCRQQRDLMMTTHYVLQYQANYFVKSRRFWCLSSANGAKFLVGTQFPWLPTADRLMWLH